MNRSLAPPRGAKTARDRRGGRAPGLLALGLALALSIDLAQAQPVAPVSPQATLARDSTLAGLVQEALEHRPELAEAEATAQAEHARVSEAGALPDPSVSVGMQNDGFQQIGIGRVESSFWWIIADQTFPWRGKRRLEAQAQSLEADASAADLERARLTARAEVERAYIDLLLVRDQLQILGRLEALDREAEGLARSRYESGSGVQTDILRAQLERSRLEQQRWALVAEERRGVAALDRAAGLPLDRPVATTLSLGRLEDPELPDSARSLAEIDSLSPELAKARLARDQSSTLASRAGKDYFPDLTVTGGVMPRGGGFDPMWQAGISFPLPLWNGSKRARVSEYQLRAEAAGSGAHAIRRLLTQRLEERRAVLGALRQANHLYRSGLLVQSEATVTSAMAQYQAGRMPFASVLETMRGYLSDVVGFYQSVAAAQRIDIAQRELSLEPVESPAGGLGLGPMPGTPVMNTPPVAAPRAQPISNPGAKAPPRM